MQKKAVTSNSFVQNVFRGMIEPTQVFPFPVALDEEQREPRDACAHRREGDGGAERPPAQRSA